MEGTIQFIQLTPDQLHDKILEGVKAEIDSLKKEFQPKIPETYMTRQEVKDLLQVDLSTLWAWTRKGKLKAYGIGSRVFYKRSEVESAIKPLS